MVRWFPILLLLSSPLSAIPFFPDNATPESIKTSLEYLAAKPVEKQEEIIQSATLDLESPVLLKLYDKSTHQDEFLHDLLGRYEKEELQELFNTIQGSDSYTELLKHLSATDCEAVGNAANPTYFGVMPIVDWLNTSYLGSFFNPTMTNALVNRDCHNEFDTFNQWNLWVLPFGFYTEFRKEADPLQFNQYTIGLSVGIERTFFDRLVLGLGAAYSHSGIEWEHNHDTAGVNSLYLGPAINYVFSYGYIGCTLFGVANFYQIRRDTQLFNEIKPKPAAADYTSFDLLARVEGGLSFTPGGRFYFSPTARIDYLHVFEQKSNEQLDEEIEMEVEGFNESFLCSKIGAKLSQEFYLTNLGFLIPSFSFGWINFSPLSTQSYHFHIEECRNLEKKVDVDSWSQYYLGAGFSIVHKKAILIALDYELTAGADSPVQAGYLRVEVSW